MKKNLLSPLLIVVLFAVVLLFANAFNQKTGPDTKKYVSIDTLLKEHKISLEIKGLGWYQENCIQFDIKNLTKDTIYILIEQGRRFVSEDTSLQDILLVRKHQFATPPHGNSVKVGYGFCCEATMHSPSLNSVFNIGFMAPKDWNKVLDVINTYDFEPGAIQSAIWVLSNDHDLSSVYSKNPENMQHLRAILAKVKGIEVPWYNLSFKQDTAMVFTGKHQRIWGSFDYQIKHNTMISINVRNLNGMAMKTLVSGMPVNPGFYTYKMDLQVEGWPKGDYEINVLEDETNLILKKHFKL